MQRTTRIGLALALALLISSSVSAQVIYDNGAQVAGTGQFGFVTGIGTGFGGNNLSQLTTPDTTLGAGSLDPNVRLADQFVVPVGQTWTINAVQTFTYQTQAAGTGVPGASTTATGNVRIIDAAPTGPFNTLGGDTTTNVLTASVFSGAFRTGATTPLNDQRAVFQNTLTLAVPLVVGPGTYWVDFAHTWNSPAGGAGFNPPITLIGASGPTGDAFQTVTGAAGPYAALVQGGSGVAIGVPFLLVGSISAVPEPATIAFFGLVGSTLGGGWYLRRQKKLGQGKRK